MFAISTPGGLGPLEMGKISRLANAFDAELELFHCIYDVEVARPRRFGTRGAQDDIHEFVEFRRQQLERTADRLRAEGVRVRTSIRWDYPTYEGIVRQVLRHKPGLLIAQTTRMGRVARLLLTRTDFKLIETCPCPVLFIKTRRPYSDVVMVAAVDPGLTHGKPAALDEEVLDSASVICDALSGKLVVFHARVPWEEAVRGDPTLRKVPQAVSEDMHSAYRDNIDSQVLALARQHNVPRQRVHVVEGDASEVLPRFVYHQMADIVAMGAVARSLLRRALIGHTTERVLDALDCDVLVVKPSGFRTRVSRQSTHHVERSAALPARYVW
jgi:universal stress protein E